MCDLTAMVEERRLRWLPSSNLPLQEAPQFLPELARHVGNVSAVNTDRIATMD